MFQISHLVRPPIPDFRAVQLLTLTQLNEPLRSRKVPLYEQLPDNSLPWVNISLLFSSPEAERSGRYSHGEPRASALKFVERVALHFRDKGKNECWVSFCSPVSFLASRDPSLRSGFQKTLLWSSSSP